MDYSEIFKIYLYEMNRISLEAVLLMFDVRFVREGTDDNNKGSRLY